MEMAKFVTVIIVIVIVTVLALLLVSSMYLFVLVGYATRARHIIHFYHYIYWLASYLVATALFICRPSMNPFII